MAAPDSTAEADRADAITWSSHTIEGQRIVDGPWTKDYDAHGLEPIDMGVLDGLPCYMRITHLGTWAGYVAVQDLSSIDKDACSVHDGVSYSGRLPWDATVECVIGFACAGSWDAIPVFLSGDAARADHKYYRSSLKGVTWRTYEFARAQLANLAAQVARDTTEAA